jgi:hypothetical protein
MLLTSKLNVYLFIHHWFARYLFDDAPSARRSTPIQRHPTFANRHRLFANLTRLQTEEKIHQAPQLLLSYPSEKDLCAEVARHSLVVPRLSENAHVQTLRGGTLYHYFSRHPQGQAVTAGLQYRSMGSVLRNRPSGVKSTLLTEHLGVAKPKCYLFIPPTQRALSLSPEFVNTTLPG